MKNFSILHPQKLPPTSAAAFQHSLRVFHQINHWMDNNLPPENYGWKIINESHKPVFTEQPIAPIKLLQLIKCGCKKKCNRKKCICKKHSMPCTSLCSCNEDHCLNKSVFCDEDQFDAEIDIL